MASSSSLQPNTLYNERWSEMKVAFTSTTGEMIDQHFGMTDSFCIWEIGPDEAHYLETVHVGKTGDDEEDKIASRVSALADCAIVYTMQIGGPAAARAVSHRIHPMKTGAEVSIAETVGKLQEVLRGNPPPWLRKALHRGAGPSFLED
jgi:nitrogen fixation protein NifX